MSDWETIESAERLDEVSAEVFVRDLFQYVLDRTSVGDREMADWMRAVLGGLSPVEVFRLFALSPENVQRRAAIRDHTTKYPNGHFYSPVVDVKEVMQLRNQVFGRGAPLRVQLQSERQLAQLARLAPHFSTLPFLEESNGKDRYHYDNGSYGFGDACVYWGMLALLRPRRIIEIGSGYSSALALDSIDRFGLSTECTFIDPYPQLLHKVAAPIAARHKVIAEFVQSVDPAIVLELDRHDILFIDSSHIVKTASDVHFELTELLPRLRPGVMVHFHDVFYPFEYPEGWIVSDNRSWNELYFLHAFLMFNSAFEIEYFNDYVGKVHADTVRLLVPGALASRLLLNPGGGLWLRRTEEA